MPPHDRSPSPAHRIINAAQDLVLAIWPDYRGDVAEALIALAEVEREARRGGAPTGWLAFGRLNARCELDGGPPNAAPEAQPRTAKDERRDALAFIDARLKHYSEIEETHAEACDWKGADRANAMASAARYFAACIRSGDHEGAADR